LKAAGGIDVFLLAIALIITVVGVVFILVHEFPSPRIPQKLQEVAERFYKISPLVAIPPQLFSLILWAAAFPYSSFQSNGISPTIGAGIGVLISAIILCIVSYVIIYSPNSDSDSYSAPKDSTA